MSKLPQNILDYYRQFNADEKLAEKAYKERNKMGSKHDTFEAHGLSKEIIDAFKDRMRLFSDIEEVYLTKRKVAYIPEDPLWVVIIKTNVPWYQIRLHNPKQQIGNYMGEELRDFFKKGTLTITVDFPLYIKKAKLVPNSLVYKR